jgi:beta-barrel assembly-enhancing protease
MSSHSNSPTKRRVGRVLFFRPAVRLLGATVLIGGFFLFPSSPSSLELISVEQEIQIGKEAHAQMRRETPILRDASVTDYVNRVARRLARVAPGPKYPYSFTVANASEINAFALPGGPIWVNRGVLQVATNESQVAGVLAHEIAHLAQRHAAVQLTNVAIANWGLALLGAMLGNTGGAGAAQVAGGFLASGSFRRFSRDDEREADRAGLALLTRAGWDGRGMIELFGILRGEQGRDPSRVESFFSTHPSPKDRIAELQTAARRHHGGRRDTAEFRAIKARLLKASALPSRPERPRR